MSKLSWDNLTERYFETGIRQGVLFLKNDDGTYSDGIAWNGLINVSEKCSGGDPVSVYANEAPYMKIYGSEEFEVTLEAYTYPDEFSLCDGFSDFYNGAVLFGLQERKRFCLCYRTVVGNDVSGIDYASKIHILYDCIVIPSERAYSTIDDNSSCSTFSWDIEVAGTLFADYNPIPLTIIDSRKLDNSTFEKLANVLYGTDQSAPTILLPDEIDYAVNTHHLLTETAQPLVFGRARILV